MKVDCVFLAINASGVPVAKDYVVNIDETAFDDALRTFRARHPGTFVTFFNERELSFHTDEIRRRKAT